MLNKKGFTLIEVLVTIAILGVIVAVVMPASINYYESSKNKTETIYVEKLNRIIDEYISLAATDFTVDKSTYSIVRKCVFESDDECREVKAYRVTNNITFQNIIDANLIKENDFINPKDSSRCDASTVIEVFQDEDKVNYFRYNLACISDANREGSYVYNGVTF